MNSIDLSQIFFFLKFAVAAISILGSIYGFVKYIDSRISTKLKDAEFVKSVAKLLRPYVIFNERGEIIIDRGAMDFIDEIDVNIDADNGLPNEIVLMLKSHNATAPILTTLDNDVCTIRESRGRKFEWRYAIYYSGYIDRDERKFNVEIIT